MSSCVRYRHLLVVAVVSVAVLVGGAAMSSAGDPPGTVLLGPDGQPARVQSMAATGTWARVFGGSDDDYGGLMLQDTDGGYIFTGETRSFGAGGLDAWLVKMDSSGNLVWQKTYGTSADDTGSVTALANGGYFLQLWTTLGVTSQSILAKLDSSGDILWQKQYGSSGESFSAMVLSDGGFLLTGSGLDMQTFKFVFRLLRLDSSGNITWQKELSGDESYTGSVQELDDGSFLIVGSRISLTGDSTVAWVMKLSSSGSILWQKTYGGGVSDSATFALPVDGGYILHALTFSFGVNAGSEDNFDLWLLKLDGSGNVLWEKAYGGDKDDLGFIQDINGSYYLAGTTDSFGAGKYDSFLAKLDSSGTPQWAKSYGGPDDDNLWAGPDDTGGFLIQGQTSSFGAGKEDSWALKTDSDGNISWQNTYGGSGDDWGFLFRLDDGTLFLSGDSDTWGAGGFDVWAMKLGSSGNLSSGLLLNTCNLIGTTSIQPASFNFTVTPTQATVEDGTATLTDGSITTADVSTIIAGTASATAIDPCGASQVLTATASADTTSGEPPLAVSFSGSGAGGTPPYSYSWSFGDGGTSTQQNPSHTYNSTGGYTAVLTVTDSASATATDSITIAVVTAAELTASASASPTSGPAPLTVNFSGSASGGTSPYFYSWSFGEGWASIEQNPSYTYTSAGTYAVVLTVTDMAGGTDTDSLTITVTEAQQLTASASADTASGTAPLAVDFSGSASGGTSPYSYSWAFGDGGSSTDQNPSHTFNSAGSYTVVLTVTDAAATTATASVAITVTEAQQLAASASADPTSGDAPLTVSFTGSASGGTSPYSFLWSFGDGGTSSEQNPSYTYNSAGTYAVLFTVTDSAAGVAFVSLTVTVTGQACTLTCSTTVPPSGLLNVPVAFAATITSEGCSAAPSILWTFGDGGTSTDQNPSHAFTSPGTYDWGLVVTSGLQVCTDSGQITISQAQELLYTVPSVAHWPGKNNTAWRTNLAAVNLNTSDATLALTFTPYDPPGGAPVLRNYTLPAQSTVEWEDVVVSLFGYSATSKGKGSVNIASNLPIYVTSRTYNETLTGTFGQYYPALTTQDALTQGVEGIVQQIKKTSSFRSNVGMQNLGIAPVDVDVKVFNASGAQIGSTLNYTVKVGRYFQYDDVFAKAGAPAADIAYATTEVTTAGGRMWSYGSVVDNITGDPTTVPVLSGSPSGPFLVASAAHWPGKNNTAWRTNLAAANRSGSDANLTLTFFPYQTGTPTIVRNYTLGAGATVEWLDVLVSLFGFSASDKAKGSIYVASNVPVYVTSRTFNETTNGTYGQYYPATPSSNGGFTSGETGVIPQIKKTSAFRTNVGMQNLGASSCTVEVKLFDASGTQVGSTLTYTLPPFTYFQYDDVFAKAGAPAQSLAWATVEVKTSGGRVFAYASVVDNATGDPTTIPALVQ